MISPFGDDPDRFLLHFNDPNPGLEKPSLPKEIQIYSDKNIIFIAAKSQNVFSGKVLVYDLAGRKLYSRTLEKTKKICIPMNVVQGIYFVSLITGSGIYTKKSVPG